MTIPELKPLAAMNELKKRTIPAEYLDFFDFKIEKIQASEAFLYIRFRGLYILARHFFIRGPGITKYCSAITELRVRPFFRKVDEFVRILGLDLSEVLEIDVDSDAVQLAVEWRIQNG